MLAQQIRLGNDSDSDPGNGLFRFGCGVPNPGDLGWCEHFEHMALQTYRCTIKPGL